MSLNIKLTFYVLSCREISQINDPQKVIKDFQEMDHYK